MSITKELKKIGIEPIRPLNFNETYKIAKIIIELLNKAFPKYEIRNDEILRKLFKSKIYFADIDKVLGKASYFYKNSVIYIDKSVDIENLDEYVIHEILHYLGEAKDFKGNLRRIGICDFREFQICGFAINEAAIQYVVSKMLNKKEEEVDFFGMKINTISKNYYPLLTSLIQQIVYITKEETLLDSIININNKFEKTINYYYGLDEYQQIQKKFDNILDLRQKLREAIEQKNELQQEQLIEKLKESFCNTQKYLYTKYFNYYLEIAENIKEIEKIKIELNEYNKKIQTQKGLEDYNKYRIKMLEQLDQKSLQIYKRNSQNSLVVISNSKIFKIFRYIKSLFIKNKYEKESSKF